MRIITATQFYILSWVGFLESLFYKRVILQNVKTENFRGNNAWIIGKFNIIVMKHLCCTMYCEIQAQCLPTWKRQRSIDTHQSHFKRAVCVCVSCSVVSDSATPWTAAHQAPLSKGFSRQEYWSMLPFPFPEDLPDPGIEPTFPALQVDSLLWEILSIEINKWE